MTFLGKFLSPLAVLAAGLGLPHGAQAQVPTSFVMELTDPGTTDFGTSTAQAVGIVTLLVDVQSAGGAPEKLRVTYEPDCATPCVFPAGAVNLPSVVAPGPTSQQDGPLGPDEILSTRLVSIDPASDVYRYEFVLNLLSNYDPATLVDTMTANETWTVELLRGSSPQGILAVCPISVYWEAPSSMPQTQVIFLGDPGAPTGTEPAVLLQAGDPFAGRCGGLRPGVDVAMVLDRSGSMTTSSTGGRSRFEILEDAIDDFVTVWADLRTAESTIPGADPASDRLGFIFFNQDAAAWPSGTLDPDILRGFVDSGAETSQYDPTVAATIAGDSTLDPAGLTSIGDGLQLADSILGGASPTARKVILLMSDGMQNTTELVAVTGASDPCGEGVVYTHPSGNSTCQPAAGDTGVLDNQDGYQIYSVTIGPSTVMQAEINQTIASATGGSYLNAEDEEELLRPFFLQLLQNFLRFTSVETLRTATETITPGQVISYDLPVTGTTQTLHVSFMAPPGRAQYELRLIPPGDGNPIVENSTGGSMQITRALHGPDGTGEPAGLWRAEIEIIEGGADIGETFSFVALVDDFGLRSEFGVANERAVPGDELRLEARIAEMGTLVTGISAQPDGRVIARLVRPGVALGDLLANSTASTEPPDGTSDGWTGVDARLNRILSEDPDALAPNLDEVVLNDDGTDGDETAGDGVYSGLYPADLPGSYRFAFAVRGTAPRAGDFARMQEAVIHVRPVPDPDQLELDVVRSGGDLVATFTPRTTVGTLMGPGWGTYFWLTVPGLEPAAAVDQLDGSYVATIPLNGNSPAGAAIHFIDRPIVLTEEDARNGAPVPLDNSTAVATDLEAVRCNCLNLWCFFR